MLEDYRQIYNDMKDSEAIPTEDNILGITKKCLEGGETLDVSSIVLLTTNLYRCAL